MREPRHDSNMRLCPLCHGSSGKSNGNCCRKIRKRQIWSIDGTFGDGFLARHPLRKCCSNYRILVCDALCSPKVPSKSCRWADDRGDRFANSVPKAFWESVCAWRWSVRSAQGHCMNTTRIFGHPFGLQWQMARCHGSPYDALSVRSRCRWFGNGNRWHIRSPSTGMAWHSTDPRCELITNACRRPLERWMIRCSDEHLGNVRIDTSQCHWFPNRLATMSLWNAKRSTEFGANNEISLLSYLLN